MFTTGPGPESGDSRFRESRPHRPEKSGMVISAPRPGSTNTAVVNTVIVVVHRNLRIWVPLRNPVGLLTENLPSQGDGRCCHYSRNSFLPASDGCGLSCSAAQPAMADKTCRDLRPGDWSQAAARHRSCGSAPPHGDLSYAAYDRCQSPPWATIRCCP